MPDRGEKNILGELEETELGLSPNRAREIFSDVVTFLL